MSLRYRAIPEYYDCEYVGLDMLQRDVPFFLEHLPRRPQSVLELAVGTGRCAIPIAQAGHRVVGVDSDARMLAIAQRKREWAGLGPRQLDLVRSDILKLDLRRRFDWVCVFFNTFLVFTTVAQQDRALQLIRAHLKPRGRLWLDIFQPNLAILSQDVCRDLDPASFYVPALDRTVARTTEVRPDPARQTQRVVFHYHWFDHFGEEHRQEVEFDLTFIFPRELHHLLVRNGLRVEKLYGDYDGKPLRSHSPRMIACCAPIRIPRAV